MLSLFCFETGSRYGVGKPWTHINMPVSASQILGLKSLGSISFYIWRQVCLTYPRLPINSLCSWRCPWTSNTVNRVPDLKTAGTMMEEPLRLWSPAHRWQHLAKREQKPNPSKSIVLRKSLKVLTLLLRFVAPLVANCSHWGSGLQLPRVVANKDFLLSWTCVQVVISGR